MFVFWVIGACVWLVLGIFWFACGESWLTLIYVADVLAWGANAVYAYKQRSRDD